MPIYEYSCKKCGTTVEALVKNYKTKPSIVCKKCGGKNFTKEVSSPGMVKSAMTYCNGVPNLPQCGTSCCGGACHHRH